MKEGLSAYPSLCMFLAWHLSSVLKVRSISCTCRERKLFPTILSTQSSAKTGMKELFAQPKVKKDGSKSKVLTSISPSMLQGTCFRLCSLYSGSLHGISCNFDS